VLRLIASVKLNKEIADELSVETSTIKTHVSNLYKKIGVTKRSEAVDYLIELIINHFIISIVCLCAL
jgi:LuxR family maltose regulon positive regulatory protein